MRLFKYLIFLTTLVRVFFIVFSRSKSIGAKKFLRSFKISVVLTVSVLSLNSEILKISSNHDQPVHEKIVLTEEFNLLDNKNGQVILVGRGDKPTNLPVSPPRNYGSPKPTKPPSNYGPRKPTSSINPRIPPKIVKPGMVINNPESGKGGENFDSDDDSFTSKKKQSEELRISDTDYPLYEKKKKQLPNPDQCESEQDVNIIKTQIIYKISDSPGLVREARTMGRDQGAQKDVNHLIEQLSRGNLNPGIGNRRIKGLKNVSEARGRNQGRVYFREIDGKIEILAKSNKDNQGKVLAIMKRLDY
jgi:hypothetical protein